MKRSRLPLTLLLAATAPGSVLAQVPIGHEIRPAQVHVTPILGNPDLVAPGALLADLDQGNLVAGRTHWEFAPDVIWIETWLGFLWTPATRMEAFTVSLPLYFQNLITFPSDLAPNHTVVGTITSTQSFQNWPFVWTPQGATQFLIQPFMALGKATTVSADGLLIGGVTQEMLFGPSRAARWNQGGLEDLGAVGQHSYVSDASTDGSVMVGASGPDMVSVQATRWIDGVEVGLALVPGAMTSSASFTSRDGLVTIGTARVAGVERLVRWAADGTVATFTPPAGFLLQSIQSINPTASAVVGALSDSPEPYESNWVPYRWRAEDGFSGLPNEYDVSEAFDVSDDGLRVVGSLRQWVFGPGSSLPRAFLWTQSQGTRGG